jgi:F-type H+/Na+-transporting ATPase subunit beta
MVDVHFPLDMPDIYNALIVQNKAKLMLEVYEHLANHTVRCLSMLPTSGLNLGCRLKIPATSCMCRLAPKCWAGL